MKRRTAARIPLTGNNTNGNLPPESSIPTDAPGVGKALEKRWELDRAEGIPAPVIRANMISLRVSYQGRVQVAFFDHR